MQSAQATNAATKGPAFRPSLVVLLGGLTLAIPSVVMVVLGFWPAFFGSTISFPGTHRVHLDHGEYVVYERTGGTTKLGPVSYTRLHGVTLVPADLYVADERGRPLTVHAASGNETIDRNTDHFVSALRFDAPHRGTYAVRFDTRGSGEVVMVHPMSAVLRARAPWIVVAVVGWLVALVGVTMLFTGVIRRGRADRRASAALAAATVGAAGPGWFADPYQQYRVRYWDGTRWTEHVSD